MSDQVATRSILGSIRPGSAQAIQSDDEMSSLQALIDILRKPHEITCYRCWGTGSTSTGASCDCCNGSGKLLSPGNEEY